MGEGGEKTNLFDLVIGRIGSSTLVFAFLVNFIIRYFEPSDFVQGDGLLIIVGVGVGFNLLLIFVGRFAIWIKFFAFSGTPKPCSVDSQDGRQSVRKNVSVPEWINLAMKLRFLPVWIGGVAAILTLDLGPLFIGIFGFSLMREFVYQLFAWEDPVHAKIAFFNRKDGFIEGKEEY